LEESNLKKALLISAWLLFLILPAYADQMGPIGSELYEEGTLSYGGPLSEIIFSWLVDEPVSSGSLDVEIFGDLNSEQEYVSVFDEDSLLLVKDESLSLAKLNGGTEFGQAHSYTIDWANPTWALDNLISFIFKPSQTVDLAYSFTTPHQPSYLKATLHANPVPEPSTVILFGTGLIGLAGWGRSRFKKS